jgi:hypothetical protein
MQGDLAEAKAQYALVDGALAALAEERIKQLDAKPTKETVEWLATVELPKRTPPTGPGTPGARPGFEATPPAADAKSGLNFDNTQSLEQILGGIEAGDAAKRYEGDAKPADEATPPADPTAPMEPAASSDATTLSVEPAEGADATPTAETTPAAEPAESPAQESIPSEAGAPLAEPAGEAAAEKPAEQ